jgi:histidinol dehydrogenase
MFNYEEEYMMLTILQPMQNAEQLLIRPAMQDKSLTEYVQNIVNTVKKAGDAALLQYCAQFDGYAVGSAQDLCVTQQEINDALLTVNNELLQSMKTAINTITAFHSKQKMQDFSIETLPGIECRFITRPIEHIGLYIPAGSAPLFSTVLMLAIPAQIAGCKQITLCTPSDRNGKIHPAILAAAGLCGIKHIIKAGGAHAIAAMAYGTESIKKSDKIFGPGNNYVTLAKQYIMADGIACDMPAGPSELAIIADEYANPHFIAADLLSQAEHGHDSQVLLLTNSAQLAQQVQIAVDEQLQDLPRKEIARKALEHGAVIIRNSMQEIIDFINTYAPEHLSIQTEQPESVLDQITNAGSIFLGPYSPESAGDYASGTNHTLPTNGAAKAWSGISLSSFCKTITVQKLSKQGLSTLSPAIQIMARAENLEAHARAASIRFSKG